ncbi:MAG TPA: hypothetical protein VF469_03235 [Kofleriaceae bacterium]
MESTDEPFTASLTIDPGELIADLQAPNLPTQGFAEASVFLVVPSRRCEGGTADLRWGDEPLVSGTTTAAFLTAFWSGARVAHADALAFGQNLLHRLLRSPEIRACWDKITAWRGTRPLRLELILPPAAQSPICAVPFELLATETNFLFYAGRSSLVRCVRDLAPRRADIHPGDRIVVAWANPADAPVASPIADDDIAQHEAAVANAARAAGLTVEPAVPRATFAQLQDALAPPGPIRVLSLVAHGYLTGGRIALETSTRKADPVPAASIATAARAAGTQVALLWSCYAGRSHAEFGSLAERLLDDQCGDLAAVVAAHGAIQADWTARAAQRLLQQLTADTGGDLEQAVGYARQTLPEHNPQWATLAYYARPANGRTVTFDDAGTRVADALTNRAAPSGTGAERVDSVDEPTPRVDGLPPPPYYFVDRPAKRAALLALLADHRLVTVQGMPGIGKTELTRAAAAQRLADRAVDAVVWIACTDVGSVGDLRARLATWAGVADPDAADHHLARAIGVRRALWVLDGAEKLIRDQGPALRALLTALVDACPGLRLLVSSQRPLGALRAAREEIFLVTRIADSATCRDLFAGAAGSPLDARAPAVDLAEILNLLDGHPRSLVLVASGVRDGGANLPALRAALTARTDEAVLAADLLDADIDWADDDHLRAERLISSLHLAYRPLRARDRGAADLFCWLGTLPAGLPVALAAAIFGPTADDSIAALRRASLVELRGDDDRLDLPTPVRWYAARRLVDDLPVDQQAELLARTFDAIAALMAAAYDRIGKPGAGAVIEASRREAANLEALLSLAQPMTKTAQLAKLAAVSFANWSKVRFHGGDHLAQLAQIQRAYQALSPMIEGSTEAAFLLQEIGQLHIYTHAYKDASTPLHRAREIFLASGKDLNAGHAFHLLSKLHFLTNQYPQGEEDLEHALAAFVRANSLLDIANASLLLGQLQLRGYKYNAAETNLRTALILSSDLRNRVNESNAALFLGRLHLLTGDLIAAKPLLDRALQTAIENDHDSGRSAIHCALAELYRRTRSQDNSLHEIDLALSFADKLKNRSDTANAYEELGHLNAERQPPRIDGAINALTTARSIFTEIHDRLGEANTRRALGQIYEGIDRKPEAEQEYIECLNIYTEIKSALGEARTRRALGILYLRSARPRESFEQYAKSYRNWLAAGRRYDAACALGCASQAALLAGLPNRAIVLCGRAQQEFRFLTRWSDTMMACVELANFAEASRNEQLWIPASLLAWHFATTIKDPVPDDLRKFFSERAATLIPPAKLASGFTPDDIAALEAQLTDEVAKAEARLAAAGEDPLGPLSDPEPT